MLKRLLIVFTGLFLLFPLQAQQPAMKTEHVFARVYRAEKDPARYNNPAKAARLLQQRAELVRKLSELRKKMIRENPQLAKLQAEFDACMVRLEKILMAKESVWSVQRRIERLDADAAAMPTRLKALEEQLAAAQEEAKSSDAAVSAEGFKKVKAREKEIATLKKAIADVPARRAALVRELRNAKRRAIRQDKIPEAERMVAIMEEMTLPIESTEEAKRINWELRAIDAELDKMLEPKK